MQKLLQDYSMKDVRRAGDALRDNVEWNDDTKAEVIRLFRIMNSYRDSHLYPMTSIRRSLISRMTAQNVGGFTSARPKRLPSIKRKLQRSPGKLDQMQDLAGVRVVVNTIGEARMFLQHLRSDLPHELLREFHYFDEPKPDGYRSHHMIFRFRPPADKEEDGAGRKVEVQVRSRLQHSWATAVEAIGLIRGEDFKGGGGDENWRRLFTLMSDEFAATERCDVRTEERQRRRELRELNKILDGVDFLERTRQAVQYANTYVQPNYKPSYYLIKFNRQDMFVTVRHYSGVDRDTVAFHAAEVEAAKDATENVTVALVEVSAVDRLREAYPNYFGDVELFARNLKAVCDGRGAAEFTLEPQKSYPRIRNFEQIVDFSWMRRRGRWK